MLSTIIIFIDGVGIGKKDNKYNPFFKYQFKTFSEIFGKTPHINKSNLSGSGIYLKGIDALLGVNGIPQSGTGQTSIFTGINAQKMIGKHFGPFPYSTLIPYLKEKSIVSQFKQMGLKTNFANAYPKIFFDYLKKGKRRLGAIARMFFENDTKFNSVSKIRRGTALSSEINNGIWVERLKYNLPVIKPITAAKRLLRVSEKNELTIFEHFLTDHFGHGRNPEHCEHYLRILDEFLFFILTNVNKENTSVIVCSDHGNLEDLSVKQHTLNPAIFISAGRNAENYFNKISRIDQIKSTILENYN